jgi:capsular exopolysaccharide synthesis family protein
MLGHSVSSQEPFDPLNGRDGSGHAPPPGVPEQGHMLDYLRILSKRRWTAASSFLLVVIGVSVYTWSVTPLYEARVQLMIEDERPRVVVFKDAIDQDRDKIDYQQTQVAILQSRGLAKRTLDTLGLWKHAEFTGLSTQPPGRLARIAVTAMTAADSLVSALSKSKPSLTPPPGVSGGGPPAGHVPETSTEARAIDAFLARLSVEPIRNTRMVVVKFTSENPKLAADIANALTSAYAAQNIEFKTVASRDAVDWLGSQLEEQRKKVEASQAALQRYREQTESISQDGRENAVMQKLNDLNAAMTHAKTERILKEARFRQVQALQANRGNIDSVPIILSNSFVQTLKSQLSELQRQQAQMRGVFGERHPDMIKLQQSLDATQSRLDAEIAKIVDAVEHDYLAAAAEEQGLANAVEAQKRDALVMRRKQIDGDALEHAVASDRQIFETLLQRTKETGVSGQSVGSNIRIIDTADMPRTPVSPRKDRNLLIAVVGGTLLAVGLAFFRDYLDKSIQTPDELKHQLGLPCLGLVPSSASSTRGEALLLNNGVPARFKEAFRTIRTNVLFASKDDVRTILVTSTGPNEGKTLVATNLAIALAQTRQRVLVIDGDMRRPAIHKALGEPQKPGLSEAAAGMVSAVAAVRPSTIPGLWMLTAGATPSNPAELLSSPAFKQILAMLSESFAWIIIDSPPVMAVTDASLIANVTGGVLFVVAAEQTNGPVAVNALAQLDGASATFIGAVLNRVDLERNPFFYSSYYRHDYGKYYLS